MSGKPTDDPRERTDWNNSSGTDEPWKRPNQKAQTTEEDAPKPDLEKWHETKTH